MNWQSSICVHLRDLRFVLCAGGREFKIQNSKFKIGPQVGGNSEFRIPNSEFIHGHAFELGEP